MGIAKVLYFKCHERDITDAIIVVITLVLVGLYVKLGLHYIPECQIRV